jgi:hypothetical protein
MLLLLQLLLLLQMGRGNWQNADMANANCCWMDPLAKSIVVVGVLNVCLMSANTWQLGQKTAQILGHLPAKFPA